MACKYSGIFGEPHTGPHKYRFAGLAVVDVLLTVLGAVIITAASGMPFYVTFLGLLLLGTALHLYFCVDTTLTLLLKRAVRL